MEEIDDGAISAAIEGALKETGAIMDFMDDKDDTKGNTRSMCFVYVHVVECTGLTVPDNVLGVEEMDPFCTLEFGDNTFKTRTHEMTQENISDGSCAPIRFNQCCMFNIGQYTDLMDLKIEVQIRDEKFLERGAVDEVLGEADISLFEAHPGAHCRKTYELREHSMLEDMLENSIIGKVMGSDVVENKLTGAKVTLDFYIGTDVEAEKTSLRLLAAANAIRRPVFTFGTSGGEAYHGVGYFGAVGLFPPLRLTGTKYYQSPIAIGWKDEGELV
jgi:hypothetical protein